MSSPCGYWPRMIRPKRMVVPPCGWREGGRVVAAVKRDGGRGIWHGAAMRLTHPSIRPVGRAISFQFDGRRIEALEGETIAAALSAAGITTFRHTPSGAPRGLFCGMGACFDCVVTVDGRIGQRACLTQAADGMDGRQRLSRPTWQPTRPRPPRNATATCWSSAAASPACRPGSRRPRRAPRSCCWTSGTHPAASSPSRWRRATPIAAPDRQFRLGTDLRARAERAGVRLEADAVVWGAFAPDEIAALVRGQSVTYHPRRLILATGAHEAPVPVPGWTLPGVMTTGGLQTLVRTQRVSPGQRVLIAGNGPLNLQLACELLAGGDNAGGGAGGGAAARRRGLARPGADGAVGARPGARRLGDAAHAAAGRRSGAVGHRAGPAGGRRPGAGGRRRRPPFRRSMSSR